MEPLEFCCEFFCDKGALVRHVQSYVYNSNIYSSYELQKLR